MSIQFGIDSFGDLPRDDGGATKIYRQGWDKAFDFFGTDNLNYAFIARNENFIASGCTAPLSVCAQSSQELEIANALTVVMMNGGAASTFLPFRSRDNSQAVPADNANGVAPDSQLCRAQLDLLMRGNKLTADEASVYDAQCACLERTEQAGHNPTARISRLGRPPSAKGTFAMRVRSAATRVCPRAAYGPPDDRRSPDR